MSKRILSICLCVLLVLGTVSVLSGCGNSKSEGAKKYGYDNNDLENMLAFVSSHSEAASADVAAKTTALTEALGDTFYTYSNNISSVTEFYEASLAAADTLFEALRSVTVDYYRCVSEGNTSDYKTWSGAMEDIYKAWTEALEDYYDTWNDSFKDIYKACNNLVKLGYDELPYKDYSKAYSDMYGEYTEAWGDMYDKYTDAWGELYDTYFDVWGAFYNGKTNIDDILTADRDDKDKSTDKSPNSETVDKPETEPEKDEETSADTNAIGDFEASVTEYVEETVSSLAAEYEALNASITTYAEYVANTDKIEAFYEKVNSTSYEISVKLYEYSLGYAEMIMKSGMSTDEMYDAFDGLYDCIYDDAGDILYDGIYEGILDDIYDDFYDGILDEHDDSVSYSDWSNARSNEYKLWSDTRSDCYEHWSGMRSDVYEFWSDMRSEMYSDDVERAQKIFEKFEKDVQKLKAA